MDNLTNIISHISLEHISMIFLLGLVLFLGTAGGQFFQRIKIPQVVGYITIGIILGQSGFRLISLESLKSLQGFSSFALALIGFMIGGELKKKPLSGSGNSLPGFFSWRHSLPSL